MNACAGFFSLKLYEICEVGHQFQPDKSSMLINQERNGAESNYNVFYSYKKKKVMR